MAFGIRLYSRNYIRSFFVGGKYMRKIDSKLNIVEVEIESLNSAAYNPRKWSDKAISDLKESINRFGFVDPLIVNSAENRHNIVIGGHFRLKVAKDSGMMTVPVVYQYPRHRKRERVEPKTK